MSAPIPTEPRKLALATAVAAIVAAVVLVVAILPAEYGIDPTGLGAALGFARLSEDAAPIVETPNGTEPPPLYEMRATWRLVSLPLAERSGTLARTNEEASVTIPLSVANLTSVTATLTWNATRGNGETLDVGIRAPGDARSQTVQGTSAPGGQGNATATLHLRSIPFPQENSTAGILIPTAEDTRGVGNWTFLVGLVGGGNVTWTLTVTGEAYELDVRKVAEREGDRVRITLRPSQGIEYKFLMRAGATLSYAWESTLPVSFDMHAEEDGKPPEDFVSFRTGTSSGDEGEHVADFPGRHGWYFANTHDEPVVITLVTTGEYEILGVPR